MSANRVGNIEMSVYDGQEHIGYDVEGEKVLRKNAKVNGRDTVPLTGDLLDNIMERMEDEYWTSIPDERQGVMMKMTEEEMQIISKIKNGEYGDLSFNPDEDYSSYFKKNIESLPILNIQEPKRKFLPSKWEAKKIRKLVKAIRLGLIKEKSSFKLKIVDLWEKEQDENPDYIAPPKSKLPSTYESYNPPQEYLPDKEEIENWKMVDDSKRERNFLPQKYSCLRHVPAYENFLKERFYRCLDLYLCPRVKRDRIIADPDELIPKLPDIENLKPFPSTMSIIYAGHQAPIRAIAPSPCGQWLLSGSDDGELRMWEVISGRCIRKWNFQINGQARGQKLKSNTEEVQLEHKYILDESFDGIRSIKWNPRLELSVFAVSVGKYVLILSADSISAKINKANTDFLNCSESKVEDILKTNDLSKSRSVKWLKKCEIDNLENQDEEISVAFDKFERKARPSRIESSYILLGFPFPVNNMSWHRKGDYFLTCSPTNAAGHSSILIHKISDRTSQNPFTKIKGAVRAAEFHPNSPKIYLCTEKHLFLYDLVNQSFAKKYFSGCSDVSSLSVHPSGEHVLLGAYDPKITWIDAQLSDKPYKSLKFGEFAIQSVKFHSKYPIFTACGDDGHLYIMYGKIFDDLVTHPLIAPIHVVRNAHPPLENLKLGALAIEFHPTQPWLFSSGSDGTIKLYVN
eukprot:NODE_59_length_28102_cov_0.971110.p3 type:complete len:685 gc:universal NODE_59_length_28102_cov_0.971110:23524-21470(-)